MQVSTFFRSPRSTWITMLLVWTPLVAALVTFVMSGTERFFEKWLASLVISEVVALLCWATAQVGRRIEIAVQRWRGRALAEHGLAWYLVLGAMAMPFALPVGFLAGGAVARALGLGWGTPSFASYRLGVGFGCAMMLLFFFLRTRSDAREAQHAAEIHIRELERARLEAQLAALTAEMNPHLLFNALNTIASLVHRDPSRAEEVVLQLSDLYRGVLRAAGSTTHALEAEMGLCRSYLEIEKARFADRLSFDVVVEPAVDLAMHVPVLVLQPFVENAVKHGIAPRARGGRVTMTVGLDGANVVVTIQDDGVGLGRSVHAGAGRAMTNCAKRLALTWGDEAKLECAARPSGGTRVTITMPCRSKVRAA